ncbi:MAG: hypothetical protein U0800_02555 [Isosphaeraceae bacterium]
MRELDKPIRNVFLRLRLQRFLSALVWCLAGCLLAAAVAVGVERLAKLAVPGPDWAPFAIAGGLSLLIAAALALFTGPSRVDAAVAIDRAFHLNERLSTALTLPQDLRETPAGRALLDDTIRHVNGLELGSKFGLRLPRRAWIPVVPAIIAVGLLFVPPEWLQSKATARATEAKAVDAKVIAKQSADLNQTIARKREAMDKKEFPEADKLLAQIEKASDQLSKSPEGQKDKALVELNKLTDAVKERQKQIGDASQIQKQMQQLKEMTSNGPADQFSKDLAKGDFQKAAKEVQKLQDKLLSGKMTEGEKKQLQRQLEEMQKKLDQMANLDQRKKQLEEARKNGTLSEEQFQKQMAKLEEQAKDFKKMAEMAKQLAEAKQAMEQGDLQKAADALGASQQELSQMAKQLEEMEMLEGSLVDIQDAKNAMNGEGMNQLGNRLDDGGLGRGNGMDGNQVGNGLGRGRGRGDRPETPDQTATYKTQVKQQIGKGAAIKVGQGPARSQTKGESVVDIQAVEEVGTELNAEALSNQKVPKAVQKHVTGYFDQFRKDQ